MNEGRSIDREAFEASTIAVTGCLVAMSCSLQDFCRMKNAKKERKMASSIQMKSPPMASRLRTAQ
jgi:hypothetical protein